MRKRIALFAVAAGLLLIGCRSFDDALTVARVANLRITLGEFRDHFRRGKDPRSLQSVPMQSRRNHLERLVDARMKYLEALRLGLDQDSSFAARFQETRDRVVMEEMMRENVLYRVVPRRAIREWYKYSGVAVRAKHILISTAGAEKPAELLAKGHRAWWIYDQLRDGVPFDSLARRYSDDEADRKSGGNPRWIRWGTYEPRICRKILELEKGEFSKPLRTEKGYELFYVVEKREVPRQPFRLVRYEILGQIRNSRLYREKINQALEKFIEQVAKYYGYEEDEWTWNHFSALMKIRKAMVLGGEATEDSDQFEVVPQKSYKYTLCRWKGDSLTIGDVIEYVRKSNPRHQPDFTNEKTRRSWIQGIARRKFLTQYAYERGYDRDPDVLEQLRNYKLRVLPTVLENRLVRQKVKFEEEEVRKYFEAHRERFKVPEARLVREILIGDYDLAEEVARRAKAGEDFIKLAKQFNERRSTKEKDGLLGWIGEHAFGELGATAIKMHKGEIAGPISVGRKWSVIRIEDERPERLKSFQEAKTEAWERYRRETIRQLTARLLADLRRRYRPVIYEKVLMRAFPLPTGL